MFDRAEARIDLDRIKANIKHLKDVSQTPVMAVVKADAYGLGISEVSTALVGEGCETFFVANIDEALELRKLHPNIAIFVFHGVVSGQEQAFIANKIIIFR